MSKHKLDLHDIYNKGSQIDDASREAMEFDRPPHRHAGDHPRQGQRATKDVSSRPCGKKVLRFLQLPDVKKTYHRIDKDRDNFRRLFVRFKH